MSVIIPCFNSGLTIRQTIKSVYDQTYPNIEIIVVDDGSNDPLTLDILNKMKDIVLIRQANAGLPEARNKGFSASNGYYVLPLDSDDWLENDAISELISTLENKPEASFSFSNIHLEGERRGILEKQYNYFEQLFLNQIPYSILIPKKIWSEIGGYDATMQNGYEDWEFNIRLGATGHFGAMNKRALFHYRVRSTGMLLSKSSKLHSQLWSQIQKKHRNTYSLKMLFKTWKFWRKKSSTYPLFAYFFWLFIHKFFPQIFFNVIFGLLIKLSQSRRVSRRMLD